MRRVASQLKDSEFLEHIDDMQLTLFRDNRLNEDEREEVFKHLAHCKRCRDVLKVASEIESENRGRVRNLFGVKRSKDSSLDPRAKPVNNIDFMGIFKPFIPLVAGVVIFIGVPSINTPEPIFKGVLVEKNIFEKSIDYWEKLFNEWFGD